MDSDQRFQQSSPESDAWAGQPAQPLESSTPVDEPWVKNSAPNTINLLSWVQLLWQHPLVFWSGIWVLLLLIMGIAMTSLMSPELSKQDHPNSTDSSQPDIAVDSNPKTLPLWALGTIALSCVAGSFLISQRFKQLRYESRSLKTHSGARASSAEIDPPEQLDVAAMTFPALPTSHAMNALPAAVSTPSTEPSLESEQPVVTVVPADESTPLDWEDAGLAEIMDIRYRRHR
ncbi:MAG: hypothetical protein SFY66_22955 [Oculatellaceae cyanobacterium bins.114]|nr:hypothetical protein [Oculatellaceae cyanobacterium bins.114]